MRKLLFAFFLLSALLEARPLPPPPTAIEENRPLQELLALFHIPPDQAVIQTQKLWLQRGKERWEFDQRYEEMRPQVWPLFEEMGLLEEIDPTKTHYTYALVHGALLERVRDRINHLTKLWNKGIRFEKIVFLTGERSLLATEQVAEGLKTEREMVEWVYWHSDCPKEIPVLFVNAPAKKRSDGTIVGRPQTPDTLLSWLQTAPAPGSCLAISNQPYVLYQHAILSRLLPEEFEAETVGPSAQGNLPVALLLDTIAKQLYVLYADP